MDKFEIVKTISTREWKPKGIFKKLKDGLTNKLGGASDAIKEAYAVVTSTIDEQLESKSTFGLHHEVTEDGKIVLNKFALAKATAELSSDKTLTEDQKSIAKAHLLRHYQELEEDPPTSLVQGEISILDATLGGMKPADIPLAPGVDLDAIKAGDDDPLEVVVSVPESKSKRGWFYAGESLQDIVKFVNANTLSGFLGHQKPDNVDTEFPTPVTHWVGAKWEDGKAYFRGVVDKVAPDLKRWIRSGRISQVSIFGIPTLKNVNGEVHVVGYDPLSIDWTPLHRAGMPSDVVAIGEMDAISVNSSVLVAFDGSHEGLREALLTALRNKYKKKDTYVWARRVFDDYVIVEYEAEGLSKLFKVGYAVLEGKVVLSDDVEEVKEQTIYTLVSGEMKTEGDDSMTLQEMLVAIRSSLAKKETDLVTVLGEMGYTSEQAVQTLAGEQMTKMKSAAEYGTKLATALGLGENSKPEESLALAGEMAGVWTALGFDTDKPENPAEIVGEMVKTQAQTLKAAQDKLLSDAIKEKVSGEQAQILVSRMLTVPESATKEQIVGEIDNLLKDEAVKGVLGNMFIDKPASKGGAGRSEGEPQYLRTKTASI